MNREQRRAAMKQAGKIKGFDITKGTLEVDIADSDDKLVVDVMDFGVTSALYELYHKFSNMEESYKEDYEQAFAEGDNAVDAKFRLMKHIVMDFSQSVEDIFGEGACIKIFGHKYPQVIQIAEFIEDFKPVAEAIINASGFSNFDEVPAAPPTQLHTVLPKQ